MTSVPLRMLEKSICKTYLGILFCYISLTFHLVCVVASIPAAAATQLPPILRTLQTDIQKAVINENHNDHCVVRSQSNTLLHHSEDESVPLICPPGYRRQASGEQCHGRYGCCICEYGTYQPHDNHCYHCMLKTFCPDDGLVFEDFGSPTNNSRCGRGITEKDVYIQHEIRQQTDKRSRTRNLSLRKEINTWTGLVVSGPDVFTTASAPIIQQKGTEDTNSANEPLISLTGNPQTFNPGDQGTGSSCGSLFAHNPVWKIFVALQVVALVAILCLAIACPMCPLCWCRVTCYSIFQRAFPHVLGKEQQEKSYSYSSVENTNSVLVSSP